MLGSKVRGLALLLMAVVPSLAASQESGVIRGRVTGSGSGEPLPAVQVAVTGTQRGAVTNEAGEYVIVGVPAGTWTVTARRIGFGAAQSRVAVTAGGTANADFTLSPAAVTLGEVVSTGTAVPAERREIGTSIGSIDSSAVTRSGAVTVDQALQGKIAGAQISQNSGNPGGGGISVRLRGTSSFISGADPLYIVDGVIVDNSSSELRNLGSRSNVQNRLADLNPADIERIEVVRGAAAAALYGSRANNGVVQIFTKRGRNGPTRINFSTRYSSSELRQRLPMNDYPFDAAGNPVTRYDYQDEIFRTAGAIDNNLSISGGNDQTTYYISGGWSDEDGILRSTSSSRRSGRINLSQQIFPKLRADFGANIINTQNEFQVNGEANGVLTAILFSPTTYSFFPVNGVYPASPVASANPLLELDRFKNPQDITRFIGSAQANYQLLPNLGLTYTFGYDTYTQEQGEFIPRGAFLTGTAANGLSANVVRGSRILNQDGVASFTTSAGSDFALTTTAGFNHTDQEIRTTSAAALDLIPVGELVSAGASDFAEQGLIRLVTLGFYGQQTVGWRDRLFVTGALRLDGSSTFGASERWQLYPKLQTSYVISEEPFFAPLAGAFSSLRLRAAYGVAGNQPSVLNAYQRFDDYVSTTFAGRAGLVNSVTLGNASLAPERQREYEVGADAGFLDNRLSVEATYYDKLVEGLLFFRPVATSLGYTQQFSDIGSLSNKGFELRASSINFDRPRFRWESTVTYAMNRNKVAELLIPDFQSASGYPNRIKVGDPVGVFYGSYAARNCVTGAYLLDSLGRLRPASSLPALDPDSAARRALGGGTCNDSTNKVLGDPNPDFLASLLNEFTIGRNLRMRVFLDGSFGNDVMNLTRRIQDLGAASNGIAAEAELLPYGDPRKLPPGYLARRLGIFEQYVEDGSYVKLREISLSYMLDTPWTERLFSEGVELTLSGRNLYVWSDYSGFDPEVNFMGQNPGRTGGSAADRGFDFASYPIPRTYSITARFTY